MSGSLEVTVHDVDQLLAGVAHLFGGVLVDRHQMAADMILEHDRQEPVHGAAAGGDLLEDVDAAGFLLDGSFDRVELAAQAADSVEKLLLLLSDMSHAGKILYPPMVYQGARKGPGGRTAGARQINGSG